MDLFSPQHFLANHHFIHHCFTSLQKLAKNCKHFSSFDETLVNGALSNNSLSAENKNDLTNLTTQMITFCKQNKCIADITA